MLNALKKLLQSIVPGATQGVVRSAPTSTGQGSARIGAQPQGNATIGGPQLRNLLQKMPYKQAMPMQPYQTADNIITADAHIGNPLLQRHEDYYYSNSYPMAQKLPQPIFPTFEPMRRRY